MVSVPLRGCGFEISKGECKMAIKQKFPSPCGDVFLKFGMHAVNGVNVLFPSPCGDDVLSASPIEMGEVASNASR